VIFINKLSHVVKLSAGEITIEVMENISGVRRFQKYTFLFHKIYSKVKGKMVEFKQE
jgi:hypothetical protein